jgi:hypothetical protein
MQTVGSIISDAMPSPISFPDKESANRFGTVLRMISISLKESGIWDAVIIKTREEEIPCLKCGGTGTIPGAPDFPGDDVNAPGYIGTMSWCEACGGSGKASKMWAVDKTAWKNFVEAVKKETDEPDDGGVYRITDALLGKLEIIKMLGRLCFEPSDEECHNPWLEVDDKGNEPKLHNGTLMAVLEE